MPEINDRNAVFVRTLKLFPPYLMLCLYYGSSEKILTVKSGPDKSKFDLPVLVRYTASARKY